MKGSSRVMAITAIKLDLKSKFGIVYLLCRSKGAPEKEETGRKQMWTSVQYTRITIDVNICVRNFVIDGAVNATK